MHEINSANISVELYLIRSIRLKIISSTQTINVNIAETFDIKQSGRCCSKCYWFLFVSDLRYQKIFSSAQPIKENFKNDRNVPTGVVANVLVFGSELNPISNDGQRLFGQMQI